jgi:hypothetical protein
MKMLPPVSFSSLGRKWVMAVNDSKLVIRADAMASLKHWRICLADAGDKMRDGWTALRDSNKTMVANVAMLKLPAASTGGDAGGDGGMIVFSNALNVFEYGPKRRPCRDVGIRNIPLGSHGVPVDAIGSQSDTINSMADLGPMDAGNASHGKSRLYPKSVLRVK